MTARVSMLLKSRASLHASELVSFLVGLRTYQHPGAVCAVYRFEKIVKDFMLVSLKLLRTIMAVFEI